MRFAEAVVAVVILCGAPPFVSAEPESPEQASPPARGTISGVVRDQVSGNPIAGAFVAVDSSGDSAGANLARFREQGIYVTAETNDDGGFILDGVAFREEHPFYVTCPAYVRHSQMVALTKNAPTNEIAVDLLPGATITVGVVDAEGSAIGHKMKVLLRAEDGRVFIPQREDWPAYPYRRETTDETGRFTFGELDSGVFSIEAFLTERQRVTYHGRTDGIMIDAGETVHVQIEPMTYGTLVVLTISGDPEVESDRRRVLYVCPDQRVLAWNDWRIHHPEDHRFGRIVSQALDMLWLLEGPPYASSIANLPPGDYAAFVATMWSLGAKRTGGVYLRGKGFTVAPNEKLEVAISWAEPSGIAAFNTWPLTSHVTLEQKVYSVDELCIHITKAMDNRIRLVANPAIRTEEVDLAVEDESVFGILEWIYLTKGWRVEEDHEQHALVLGPGDA